MLMKTFWCGLALVAIAWISAPRDASAQVASQRMPRDVDSSNAAGWWRPLVVRSNGEVFTAFDAPGTAANNHYVKFGRRVNPGGVDDWTFGFLKNADGTAWLANDDPGHNQPTMAIDGDGFIHVWADGHDDVWQYFRSTAAYDVTDIRRASGMPGSVAFTYPVAATAPNGDVYLMIRNQTGGTGNSRADLFRWNDNTNTWGTVAEFARQAGYLPYPNSMVIDSVGDVHLAWEWAHDHARGLRHYGSYLRYEPSTGVFRNVWNTVVPTPVNFSTPDLFYRTLGPNEVLTSNDDGAGIQSAALAVDNLRRPSVVYRYRPNVVTPAGSDPSFLHFNVYRVRWNGSEWVDRVQIYTADHDVPAALGQSHNGTRVRTYFATTGGGLMVAQNTDSWIPQALDPSKAVRRLSAVALNSSTDIVYACAPTDIDANTGSVYIFNIGATLP